jgi:Spy/CpxP family protein refolding chaperone
MGAGPGWRAQALGLSADQQKQVSALQSRFDADVAPVHAQMAAKRSELQALWSAPAPDRRAILAKQAEMEPLREKIRTAQVDFQLAVQKVLTPEQREAWTNMRGPGHCRGGQGPGGGGFGGNEMPCGGSVPQSW